MYTQKRQLLAVFLVLHVAAIILSILKDELMNVHLTGNRAPIKVPILKLSILSEFIEKSYIYSKNPGPFF